MAARPTDSPYYPWSLLSMIFYNISETRICTRIYHVLISTPGECKLSYGSIFYLFHSLIAGSFGGVCCFYANPVFQFAKRIFGAFVEGVCQDLRQAGTRSVVVRRTETAHHIAAICFHANRETPVRARNIFIICCV